MRLPYPVILFFISGAMPTDADYLEADTYGPNVKFRNARFVDDTMNPGAVEKCDGVAGAVPKPYQKFPTADEALAAYEERRQALRQKVADNAAGTPPVAPSAPVDSEPAKVEAVAAAPAKNETAAAGWTANK